MLYHVGLRLKSTYVEVHSPAAWGAVPTGEAIRIYGENTSMIRLIFKQLDAREPLPLVAYYLGDGVVRSDRLAIAILGEECVSSRGGGCRC